MCFFMLFAGFQFFCGESSFQNRLKIREKLPFEQSVQRPKHPEYKAAVFCRSVFRMPPLLPLLLCYVPFGNSIFFSEIRYPRSFSSLSI